MPKRILFAPIHGPSMIEMLPVAKKLVQDRRFEPVFFIFRDFSANNYRLLSESGVRAIGPKAASQPQVGARKAGPVAIADPDPEAAAKPTGKALLTKALTWIWFSFLWYLVKFGWQLVQARRVFLTEDLAAVIVMGDRHVGWETALIKAANDRNIPTMIVPFAMSDPASDAEIRLRSPDADQYRVSTWFEKVISRRFPGWVNESQGERLFFTPPGNALAARVLGIMPELPWTLGGGATRRMAVESPRQREAFLAQGVPLAKMVVTGKPSVDRIYERIQRLEASELRGELGIRGDQPVILCSVPQLAEHRLLSWPEHWRETEFLFATLTQQPGAAVILSIHPQSDPEAYRPLASKYGAVIARQRIYDLIPVCDILVATYSSVVVQAIGCGKPAVVVDFYGLGFTYYDDEPGVLVIRDRDQLAPTIQRLNYNRQYYEQMAEAQRQRAPEWVLLDGQCTQRVVDEIYQMAAD